MMIKRISLKQWPVNLFYLFLFLLPWQTAWIFNEQFIGGVKWQYGSMALYATEILLWVMALFMIVSWISDGCLSGISSGRKLFKRPVVQTRRAFIVIAIWLVVLWGGLSTIWSVNQSLSFYWWFKMLAGAVLFFIIVNLKFDLKKAAKVIVTAGVIQAVLALTQLLWQQVIASEWLGIAGQSPGDPGVFVIESAGGRWLRSYGSFTHPNVLGGFLVLSWLLCLWLYLNASSQKSKIISAVSLAVLSIGLFATFSRSAILALIVGYGLALVLSLLRRQSLLIFMKPMLYLLAVFAVLYFIYQPLVDTRLSGDERLEVQSTEQRLASNFEAQDIIADYWLAGVGLGGYTYRLYQNQPDLPAWDYQPAHNLYLLILAELGLVGLVAWLFVNFYIIRHRLVINGSINIFGLALVMFLIIGIFDHYLWTHYVGLMMYWSLLGLTVKT